MASGQTTNYGLNQWAAEDPVLRTDFNADNAKLDAALPRIIAGSYVGTGEAKEIHYEIGARPKILFLCTENTETAGQAGLLATETASLRWQKTGSCNIVSDHLLVFTDTGFTINHDTGSSTNYGYNQLGKTTRYFAIC